MSTEPMTSKEKLAILRALAVKLIEFDYLEGASLTIKDILQFDHEVDGDNINLKYEELVAMRGGLDKVIADLEKEHQSKYKWNAVFIAKQLQAASAETIFLSMLKFSVPELGNAPISIFKLADCYMENMQEFRIKPTTTVDYELYRDLFEEARHQLLKANPGIGFANQLNQFLNPWFSASSKRPHPNPGFEYTSGHGWGNNHYTGNHFGNAPDGQRWTQDFQPNPNMNQPYNNR